MVKKQQKDLKLVSVKQSRAGMFEDDDEDVPIVKEIEYLPSPVKEKKKDKKEKKDKKKDKSDKKENSKNEELSDKKAKSEKKDKSEKKEKSE